MAVKYLFIIALAITFVASEDACDCNSENTKELWEYLTEISKNPGELTDEEEYFNIVLPGVLSPLSDCNCLNDRRKRSITPSVKPVEVLSSPEVVKTVTKPARKRGNKLRYHTRSCPVGYVRIVYWCVPEEKIA